MNAIASCACSGVATRPGADRPDRLVGDHDLGEALVGHAGEVVPDLLAQLALGVARRRAPDSVSPTHRIGARPAASAAGTFSASARSVSPNSCAPLGVAEHHAAHVQLAQHRRRDLAGERALGLVVHVLRVHLHARAARAVDHRAQVGERHADRHVDAVDRGHARQQRLDVLLGLRLGLVHLPVARDQRRARGAVIRRPPPAPSSACTPGRVLALDQLERRAAAGGEVVDRVAPGRTARAPPPSRRRRRPSGPARSRDRLGHRARARRERLQLERAHRPVPEDRARARDLRSRSARRSPGRCRGPSSRPAPRPRRARGARRRPRGGRRSRGRSAAAGARWPGASACAWPSARARVLDVLVVAQRVADRVALRAQEREAHRAADDHHVGELQEAVDHARSCPPPWRRRRSPRAGAAGCSRIPVSVLTSRSSSRPAALGSRCATPSVLACARWAAPKASLTYTSASSASARASSGSLLRLARLEAHVLEHQHARRRASASASAVTSSPDDRRARASRVAPVSSRRRVRDRRQRQLRHRARPRGVPDARRAPAARRARAALRSSAAPRAMRVSSATDDAAVASLASGTLKSTRTSTRLPRTSRSSAPHRARALAVHVRARRCSSGAALTGPSAPGRRGGWSSPTRCRTRRRPSASCRRSTAVSCESTIEENGERDDVAGDDRVLGVGHDPGERAALARRPSARR